jgi:hypothetical protein
MSSVLLEVAASHVVAAQVVAFWNQTLKSNFETSFSRDRFKSWWNQSVSSYGSSTGFDLHAPHREDEVGLRDGEQRRGGAAQVECERQPLKTGFHFMIRYVVGSFRGWNQEPGGYSSYGWRSTEFKLYSPTATVPPYLPVMTTRSVV